VIMVIFASVQRLGADPQHSRGWHLLRPYLGRLQPDNLSLMALTLAVNLVVDAIVMLEKIPVSRKRGTIRCRQCSTSRLPSRPLRGWTLKLRVDWISDMSHYGLGRRVNLGRGGKEVVPLSEALLGDVAEYCRGVRMAESTFGRLAVNDGTLVSRLRPGSRVATDT